MVTNSRPPYQAMPPPNSSPSRAFSGFSVTLHSTLPVSASNAETVLSASVVKTLPSATTGGVVRMRDELEPLPMLAVQMTCGESPIARCCMA